MSEDRSVGTWPQINIILTGMAGSGKSTIGRLLARTLSCEFTDTDSLMERDAGLPLQEIIETAGLDGFRLLEEKILLGLNLTGHVIATGGSSVYSDRGMQHLRKNGIVIFLEVEPALLLNRIRNFSSRGLVRLPDQSFIDLYSERLPLYHRYADHIFFCGKLNKQEICSGLVRLVLDKNVPGGR